MPNMTYCRFHNTKLAFEDCLGAMRDMIDNGNKEEALRLSEDEYNAMTDLVALAVNMLEEFGPESEGEIPPTYRDWRDYWDNFVPYDDEADQEELDEELTNE